MRNTIRKGRMMASVYEPEGDRIEIKVPCKAEYVRTIRKAVADFATSFDLPITAVEALEIAASEAVANAVRHAYKGSTRMPSVRVKCAHSRDRLIVEVIDKGKGFDAPPVSVIPDVDFDKEGGLGIILIKSLMDRVHYVSKPDKGTRIKMTMNAKHSLNSHLDMIGHISPGAIGRQTTSSQT